MAHSRMANGVWRIGGSILPNSLFAIRYSPSSLQRALDGFDFEGFDDVALLQVLVVGEGHAAFLAALHLAHLVLEALERGEFAFVDDHVVADEAHLGAAAHHALGHAAARDLADLGDREDLQDLGIAKELLA